MSRLGQTLDGPADANEPQGRRWLVWLSLSFALLVLVGAWLLWAVVPGVAARWGFDLLETEYGVAGRAGEISFDPLRLRLRVRDLSLAVVDFEDQPFLTVDAVAVDVPWAVVFGTRAIQSIDIVDPVVSVSQTAEGASNLPTLPASDVAAEPDEASVAPGEPWQLGSVSIQGAMVSWTDATRELSVATGPIGLALQPTDLTAPESTGRLTVSSPTRLVLPMQETNIEPIDVALTLAPSALTFHDLVLAAPEGRLQADGAVGFGVPTAEIGLDYGLDLALQRLTSWSQGAVELTGALRVAGRVEGATTSPRVTMRVESERVGWNGLDLSDLVVALAFDGERLAVDQVRAGVAGGTVQASGTITLGGEETAGDLRASWDDLRADIFSAVFLPGRPAPVVSTLDGTANLVWSGHEPQDISAVVESRHAGTGAEGLALDGRWRLEAGDDGWALAVDRLAAGTASLAGTLTGTVPAAWSELTAVSIEGALDASVVDLRTLGQALETAGLTTAVAELDPTGSASVRVAVSGTLGAPEFIGDLVATGSLPGRLDDLSVEAAFSATDAAWRVERADVQVAGGTLSAAAAVSRDTGAIDGHLAVEIPDFADLATLLPDDWQPGGSMVVDATFGGETTNPVVEATFTAADLAVAGQRLSRVDGRVAYRGEAVLLDELVIQQEDGRLDATARWVPDTGAYSVSMTGRDLRVAPVHLGAGDPIPVAGTIDLELTGAGSTADPRATGRLVLREVSYGDYAIDRIEHELSLDAGEWRVRSHLPTLAVDSELTVEPGPSGRYRLTAGLTETDLARVASLAPGVADALSGVLTLSVVAEGEVSAPAASTVQLQVERLSARIADAPIELAAPVRLRYGADAVRFERPLDLRVGGMQVTATGELNGTSRSALSASVVGDLRDLGPLLSRDPRETPIETETAPEETQGEETAAAAAWPELAGSFRVDARVVGSIGDPALSVLLALDDGSVGVPGIAPVTDLSVRAGFEPAGVRLGPLTARWRNATLRAEGAVPAEVLAAVLPEWLVDPRPDAGPASLSVAVEQFRTADLSGILDPATLSEFVGEVDLDVRLEADALELPAVQGALTLIARDVRVAGLPLSQQRPTRLLLADGRVTLDQGMAWQIGAENVLTLGGHVDLLPEPTADLTVTGNINLGILSVFSRPVATDGNALLLANIQGTLMTPNIAGVIEISDADIRVPEPRLVISDLNGALVFQGTSLRTIELVGTANGGSLRIDADIQFPEFRPTGFVSITGREMAIGLPPGLRTELDTDIRVTLPADDDMEVSGTVAVVRGDFREAVNTAGGLRALLESQQGAEVPRAEPSALDAMRLNVQVLTREEIVVDNNYGAGTVSANVRLEGTLGRPGVTGRLSIGEGAQLFLGGNDFEIETGTIDLVDPGGIAPELDITARTQVGPEEITITIEGTAETLTTTMQSSPNDYPESDIVSLLLTGRTLDQVGVAPGAVARDQALGLVSSGVLGAAGRSVGLDTVRLDQGSTVGDVQFDSSLVAGDANPGTRLTVGKHLSRQVELVASQNLRESGLITWIVNYLPTRTIGLRLVVDDETDRSYEFSQTVSFGNTRPRAARVAARRVEPRVTAVRFSGDPAPADVDLARLVRVRSGDRFNFLRWQDGRDRIERALRDRGYLEAQVRPRRATGASGDTVELEYGLRSGPRSVLEVTGYGASTDLRRDMEAAWQASVFDTFLVEELTQVARRHLVGDGYLQPVITTTLDPTSDEAEKRIVVEIETGPRTRRRIIRFSGHDRLPTERLEALVTPERETDAWAGGDELVRAVVSVYRSEGWLDAAAQLEDPVFEGDEATVVAMVTEGRQFFVSTVEVDGAERWTQEQARSAAGIRPRDVYRAGLAETARAALLAGYRAAGFTDVRVGAEAMIDADAAAVSVRLSVTENRRQMLETVDVQGATVTSPAVVNRALRLTSGEPVDPVAWNQSRKRLYDTGVFRSVDIVAERVDRNLAEDAGEDQPVVARVALEEWPTYRARYGLQLIDEQVPLGESDRRGQLGVVADLTRRNFFGRAITVGSSARFDTVQQVVRGFMVFPSFFGRAVSSNVYVSRLRAPEGSLATSNINRLTLEQRVRPREGVTLAYSYNFERNHTVENDFDPTDAFAFDVTIDIARLSGSLIYERRDDLFNATSGWFHSSTVDWGVQRLGSALGFLKYVGQQMYFRPLARGVVLASSARIGIAEGFDDQQLIESELFFAGGSTTVRGYVHDGLGPVNVFGNVIGGYASVILNQEVRFPLWKIFRGVGFVDAGNVFNAVSDVSFGDLKVATGLGLRAETPVGLIRFDYGVPVSPKPGDPGSRWFFSIGQAF